MKEQELQKELYEYLLPYYKCGIDAVIVQDIGVLQYIKRNFPDLPIHASTQMTVTNVKGAKFVWFTDGAGWKSAARNLEETFDVLDDIYNINDMQNGIMKEVFK